MKSCFNVVYVALWSRPDERSPRLCFLPAGSILLTEYETSGEFTRVIFRADRDYIGWTYSTVLDAIINPYPVDMIELPEPTHSLQDLKQYVKLYGNIQYNLCGELCVAFITGEKRLLDLLEKWQVAKPSVFRRVFARWISNPTGLPDLISMLDIYAKFDLIQLKYAFYNATLKQSLLSPLRFARWLEDGWQAIVGVKINRRGWLKPSGILHWVVVTEVQPVDVLDGTVYLYNPASNGKEQYSWDEFSTSMGVPSGLLVKLS